jgi:putative Mg2+ transporter-C (MgtC) family protein
MGFNYFIQDIPTEMHMILQVILAFLLGGIIGWEREHHSSQAGIRTYAAISVGSCVFGLISLHAYGVIDPTRIAAQVVTGIGFLGAGVIFRQGNAVNGLTTAATLWGMASIGLAVAYAMYVVAVLTTVLIFILLWLPRISWWRKISKKRQRYGIDHDSKIID